MSSRDDRRRRERSWEKDDRDRDRDRDNRNRDRHRDRERRGSEYRRRRDSRSRSPRPSHGDRDRDGRSGQYDLYHIYVSTDGSAYIKTDEIMSKTTTLGGVARGKTTDSETTDGLTTEMRNVTREEDLPRIVVITTKTTNLFVQEPTT